MATLCAVVSEYNENTAMMWHYRLGHPNFMYLKEMLPKLFNKNQKLFQYKICQISKHTRSPHPPQPYKHFQLFCVIHSDVCGLSLITNVTGSRWFVTFIDDHTRITWVYLMKHKLEVSKIFQCFHTMVQTQFQNKIRMLRSDIGRECYNYALSSYFQQHGIIHQISCVDTP